MSSRHHHGSRSGEGSSRKRSARSPDDSPRSGSESGGPSYRDLYKELKYELKRKKRDLLDAEDNLDRERRETKKAKQDTQDLWKIYYTLQQELQQSYERNSKLQAEKALSEAVIEKEKQMLAVRAAEANEDPSKLKEALCTMQREKMELQQRFNDIVLENKKLKEKEATYEPRLQEMDQLRIKLDLAQVNAVELSDMVKQLSKDLAANKISRDRIEEYQRWNSLLIMESQQKAQRIEELEPAGQQCEWLKNTIETLQQRLQRNATETREVRAAGVARVLRLREGLARVQAEVRQLRMDWRWSGDAVKMDLTRGRETLRDVTTKARDLIAAKQAAAAAMQSAAITQAQPSSNNTASTSTTKNDELLTGSPTSGASRETTNVSSRGEISPDSQGRLARFLTAIGRDMEQRTDAVTDLRNQLNVVRNQLETWEKEMDRRYSAEMVELQPMNGGHVTSTSPQDDENRASEAIPGIGDSCDKS